VKVLKRGRMKVEVKVIVGDGEGGGEGGWIFEKVCL
jgi:hypothetical protein